MTQQNQLVLTEEDIEAIVRTAATEVGHGGFIQSHPEVIAQMAEAVADTIINRAVAHNFPDSVGDVVNQSWQFSAINVPQHQVSHRTYGRWQNVPDSAVHPFLREHLNGYLEDRARGAPSRLEQLGIPGALNFANPTSSSRSNRDGWIADMQRAGARRLGIGRFEHYHGTDPCMSPLSSSPTVRIAGIQPGPLRANPANDFNAQELDAIAPPLPATPEAMRRARLPPNPVPRPSEEPSTRLRGQSQDSKSRSVVSSEDRAPGHSGPRTSSRAAMIEQHRLRALETETRRVRPSTHHPMRRSRPQRRLRPGA